MPADKTRGQTKLADAQALALYQSLDQTERQILACYAEGLSSQVIMARFEMCEITTEAYRARLMRKLQAGNLIELLVRARLCTLATSSGDAVPRAPLVS